MAPPPTPDMARRIVQVLADLDVLRHDVRLLLAMVQRLDRTLSHAIAEIRQLDKRP